MVNLVGDRFQSLVSMIPVNLFYCDRLCIHFAVCSSSINALTIGIVHGLSPIQTCTFRNCGVIAALVVEHVWSFFVSFTTMVGISNFAVAFVAVRSEVCMQVYCQCRCCRRRPCLADDEIMKMWRGAKV